MAHIHFKQADFYNVQEIYSNCVDEGAIRNMELLNSRSQNYSKIKASLAKKSYSENDQQYRHFLK